MYAPVIKEELPKPVVKEETQKILQPVSHAEPAAGSFKKRRVGDIIDWL